MAKFQPLEAYKTETIQGYDLLPLRFHRLSSGKVFVSNLVGEWQVLATDVFENFVSGNLATNDPHYDELRSKHLLIDGASSVAYDLLALKLRTRLSHLRSMLGLAIFVVSLRCEHSCPYCQVSRQSDDRLAFDMSSASAHKALDLLFASPADTIKIEFQGGESLLNFELIEEIVLSAKEQASTSSKSIEFVIATNLAMIDDRVLAFCKEHDVFLSTSLDGPEDLHNKNRPRPGNNSHELATAGIKRAREVLGVDKVAALMTTTEASLSRAKDIIDEYRRLGLHEIFLRPLSPYGFAMKTKWYRAYEGDDWIEFYKKGLREIIAINKQGEPFVELYAATILRKMLTPWPDTYVDMMNPAGIGTQVIVFNYNGKVYASDEARMLAEMGDDTFMIGDVHTDALEDMLTHDNLLPAVEQTVLESAPMCSDCAFQTYCGADPVFHHATQEDVLGHKPTSSFCNRQMAIFEELVDIMESDPEARSIFRSWVAAP